MNPLSRGNVMTARGQVLNMEELIMKAKRPMMSSDVDMKDKVPSRKQPVKRLNVRGFMPSHEGVRPRAVLPPPPVAEETGPSLADLTGVTVDNPKRLRERPEDPTVVANEALRGIMDDLEQFKGRDTPQEPSRRKKA